MKVDINKFFEKVYFYCEADNWDPEEAELALQVRMASLETNVHEITRQMMMAFADEIHLYRCAKAIHESERSD